MLYHFGGTYIDLDVIILDSGFFAKRFNIAFGGEYNNAHLKFGRHDLLLWQFMENFHSNFNGQEWGHNGPRMVERVLRAKCNAIDGRLNTNTSLCRNLLIADAKFVAPVHYTDIGSVLRTNFSLLRDWQQRGVLAFHWFHKRNFGFDRGKIVEVNSTSILRQIMQHSCPSTVDVLRCREEVVCYLRQHKDRRAHSGHNI